MESFTDVGAFLAFLDARERIVADGASGDISLMPGLETPNWNAVFLFDMNRIILPLNKPALLTYPFENDHSKPFQEKNAKGSIGGPHATGKL